MISNLLAVGVDGCSSDQAVRWAIDRAIARNSSLEFVHALPGPPLDSEEPDGMRRGRGQRLVDREAALAQRSGAGDVRVSVEDQPVGAALVAASQRAGLLVIGRRDTSAVVRRRSASVSRHLSRYSACPVVVVPATARARPTRRIVLLLNGKSGDRAAMSFAFDQAAATGAEIQAIHAWREPDFEPYRFSPLIDEGAAHRLCASEVLMAEELAGYSAIDPDVQVNRASVPGDPGRAVLAAAEHADLIVLPARVPTDDMLADGEPELTALRHALCPVVYAR